MTIKSLLSLFLAIVLFLVIKRELTPNMSEGASYGIAFILAGAFYLGARLMISRLSHR